MNNTKQAAMDRTGELSADERTTSLLAHMLDASGDKRGDYIMTPYGPARSAASIEAEEILATWPERIYLQCTDGWEDTPSYDDVSIDDVTWCAENINDSDVAYVRADVVAAQLQAARAAALSEAELLDWLEQHDDRFYNIDKITSIVGIGFWPAASIAKFETLREAIRAAIAAGGPR